MNDQDPGAARNAPKACGTVAVSDRATGKQDGITGLSEAAIGTLYKAEYAKLRGTARRCLGDADEAADVVQDAFARLLQARPAATMRTPAAYLRRIVRNLLADRAKRAERRWMVPWTTAGADGGPFAPPEQHWQLEAADLLEAYQAAVESLPPRTREVFVLHRIDELRYREIAARLEISVATVEYHMARALAYLDRVLER